MSENKPLPEVFPRIYFDVDHKDYIGEIDVDLDAVTSQLREGGLSDQEILNLDIHFKTRLTQESFGSDTVGRYHDRLPRDGQQGTNDELDGSRKYIEVGYYSLLKQMRDNQARGKTMNGYILEYSHLLPLFVSQYLPRYSYADRQSLSDVTSEAYSKVLAHELDHAVAFRDPKEMEEDKVYLERTYAEIAESVLDSTDFAARLGLAFILVQREIWNQYIDRPIEKRARQAGELAVKDLVSIRPKREKEN